ncbi:lysozyme [Christiangramia fulva]|nr:lysozyme [Christiangramia fulva]
MEPSDLLVDFVAEYEQKHDGSREMIGLQPKPDAVGNWTEGFGHAMIDEYGDFRTVRDYPTLESILPFSQVHTDEEAWALLKWDLRNKAAGANMRLRVELPQNKFDAILSHSFNCGYSQKLYHLVNTKAPDRLIKEWFTKHYVTANGIKLQGLVLRRHDEWEIFSQGEYKRDYKISA